VDEALSIAMHAMRAGVHSTLGSSPGNLVFKRDVSQHSLDCGLACHHTKKRTSFPGETHERKPEKKGL
jgi:hypothetical protein